MAAFCGCCGAEITLKTSESCPLCGAPTHGLLQPEPAMGKQEISETTGFHKQRGNQIARHVPHKSQG